MLARTLELFWTQAFIFLLLENFLEIQPYKVRVAHSPRTPARCGGNLPPKKRRGWILNVHVCGDSHFHSDPSLDGRTAALLWPEGVEELLYQNTTVVFSKHSQLGWRMARASPSVPRETRTYSLNNKANKEQQKEDIREKNGILFFYPGNVFSFFILFTPSPLSIVLHHTWHRSV